MSGHNIFQVDAFTDKCFQGNPAGVCLLDAPADESWMQSLAMEMNLSETAFISPREQGFELRWFTPAVEVDLCGHATLASAHILWKQNVINEDEPAVFHTRSGVLTAKLRGALIEMDFPAEPERACVEPESLRMILGAELLYCGKNRFDYLVEVESEDILLSLKPNMARLGAIETRGVIVTCVSERDGIDFSSRFFAPAVGVDEDPVTGSAHCCLGPYWEKRLNKLVFTAYQASARGGVVHVAVSEDRVHIGGKAVTVFRGSLM